MSDDGPENLVLRYLRNIDAKIDRLSDRVGRLEGRMTSVEQAVLSVRRDILQVYDGQVNLQHTLDAHGERLDRIERRLELLPA
jgi:hypothetical protein